MTLREALDRGLALLEPDPSGQTPRRIALAYSGGRDSSVLLHLLARHPGLDVVALHVHHGLSPNADAWLAHCQASCARLGVRFDHAHVNLDAAGASLEAAAREARYTALARLCARHGSSTILTAHHAGDQAETVLINLLRGSGVAGLAGMHAVRRRGALTIVRPLLGCDQVVIARYALAHDIAHIEDESNRDTRHTRNAVRQRLMPVLQDMVPTAVDRLNRTAEHAAAAEELLAEIARADLATCGVVAANEAPYPIATLRLAPFNLLPPARATNALRAWLRTNGLRMPTTAALRELQAQLRATTTDTAMRFVHDGIALRLHRGVLHVDDDAAPTPTIVHFRWQGEAFIDFPAWRGRLLFLPADSTGVPGALLRERPLSLVPRRGGERLQLGARRPHRSLKNLFQEAGIPSWQRPRLPLLYAGDDLLMSCGLGVDARWLQARPAAKEELIHLAWQTLAGARAA